MLDQVEIFHGLSDEELKALEGSSTTRAFPKNTVVIHENDPADSLFVIEAGKVKVYCSDKNGKEFIMNTLGPGDYFGELALLDDSTRSASVRTVEKSEFRIVMKEDFSGVLEDHPGITKQLISNLAGRVRKLDLDGVTNVGKNVVRPQNVIWVVVGDRAKIEEGIRELNLGELSFLDADGNPVETGELVSSR